MGHVEFHNWRKGLSLLQRIKYMMEGQYACDVTLKVGQDGSQETINAHRFILIAGSPYFESLIGQMSPANDQPITLRDTAPDVMKQFIKFLYSEKVDLSLSNVLDVMVASKKYEVPHLTQACTVFLEKSLTPDNVSTILTQSITLGENTLADKCVGLISQNTKQVFESDNFNRMSEPALMRVVKSDIMSGVTEVDVYKACIGWADQRCRESGSEISDRNRREALGDVLFRIRFPTMTTEAFAKLSHNSSLLTGDEQTSIYQFLALRQTPGFVLTASKFAHKKRHSEGQSVFSQPITTSANNFASVLNSRHETQQPTQQLTQTQSLTHSDNTFSDRYVKLLATDANIGESAAHPGIFDKNTGQLAARPGIVDTRTGQLAARPGIVDKNTGQLAARPGIVDKKTGQLAARPGIVDKNTGQLAARPVIVDTRTGQLAARPGIVD